MLGATWLHLVGRALFGNQSHVQRAVQLHLVLGGAGLHVVGTSRCVHGNSPLQYLQQRQRANPVYLHRPARLHLDPDPVYGDRPRLHLEHELDHVRGGAGLHLDRHHPPRMHSIHKLSHASCVQHEPSLHNVHEPARLRVDDHGCIVYGNPHSVHVVHHRHLMHHPARLHLGHHHRRNVLRHPDAHLFHLRRVDLHSRYRVHLDRNHPWLMFGFGHSV